MAGLQRSTVSFRRQGSSGLVWDGKTVSGELNKQEHGGNDGKDDDLVKTSAATVGLTINTMERSRSNGGGRGFRTGKVTPALEPPSPKVSVCGFCGAFGKSGGKHDRRNPGNRKSRKN